MAAKTSRMSRPWSECDDEPAAIVRPSCAPRSHRRRRRRHPSAGPRRTDRCGTGPSRSCGSSGPVSSTRTVAAGRRADPRQFRCPRCGPRRSSPVRRGGRNRVDVVVFRVVLMACLLSELRCSGTGSRRPAPHRRPTTPPPPRRARRRLCRHPAGSWVSLRPPRGTVPSASRTPVTVGVPTKASAWTPSRSVTPRRASSASATAEVTGSRIRGMTQVRRPMTVVSTPRSHSRSASSIPMSPLPTTSAVWASPRRTRPSSSVAVRRDLKSSTPGRSAPSSGACSLLPEAMTSPSYGSRLLSSRTTSRLSVSTAVTTVARRSSMPSRSATSVPFQYRVWSRPVRKWSASAAGE